MAPADTGIDAWDETIETSVDARDINKLQHQIEREPMRVVPVKDLFRPNLATSLKPNQPTYLQQVLAAQQEAARLQLQAAQHYKPGHARTFNMDQHRKPKGWHAQRQFSSSSNELIPRPQGPRNYKLEDVFPDDSPFGWDEDISGLVDEGNRYGHHNSFGGWYENFNLKDLMLLQIHIEL